MACACKNKLKTINHLSGYEDEERKLSFFEKIMKIFSQICIGIIVGVIIIVIGIPLLFGVIICLMCGKQLRFNPRSLEEYYNKYKK